MSIKTQSILETMVSIFFLNVFFCTPFLGNCVFFSFSTFSDAAIMNGKNTNRNEVDKKKTALGDIKNAQSLNSGEKLSVKTVHVEASEDDSGNEFASSKAVDYHKVWVERVTLTDNEIDRWVTMLNAARNINPYDETKPLPIPEEDIHFEESKCLTLETLSPIFRLKIF